ncbi:hypothetical protein [Limnohabitans sp. DM1]|uniref:hypothetical protein n=1 Tax=Limnohabitans sp. DM1 TaxID=1597955 RepID=UPI000B025974|nr:hypothetical protein [Limnohabitans sp. DM1]
MGQIDSVRAVRDTCIALAWDGVRSVRVHAPGGFNLQSVVWTAWREGLQPHCRVRYWDVWYPQLAAGRKRFVVWVAA